MTVTGARMRPPKRARLCSTVLMVGAVVVTGCSSWDGRSETTLVGDHEPAAAAAAPSPDRIAAPDGAADAQGPPDPGSTGRGGPHSEPADTPTSVPRRNAAPSDASAFLEQLLPVDPGSVPSNLASSGTPALPDTGSANAGSVEVGAPVAAAPVGREQEALASITYNWRAALPGWNVRFLPARAGIRGSTRPAERVIDIYVRRNDTADRLAYIIAHELGHALDVTWLTEATRSGWAATRGLPGGVSWFVADGTSDFASGAGDFAESFAWWQTGGGDWSGQLSGPPTAIELGVLASLVPWR